MSLMEGVEVSSQLFYEKKYLLDRSILMNLRSFTQFYMFRDIGNNFCMAISKRNENLRKRYRITEKVYNSILKGQGGKCAICGTTESKTKWSDNLFVDHCHDTGLVRGLLCTHCNKGLSGFQDSIKFLKAAIEYLTPLEDPRLLDAQKKTGK